MADEVMRDDRSPAATVLDEVRKANEAQAYVDAWRYAVINPLLDEAVEPRPIFPWSSPIGR